MIVPAYRKRFGKLAPGVAMVLASVYFVLLVAELGLWWRSLPSSRVVMERGMYLADSTLGVVLKPGYDGTFDDGHAKGRMHINSLGNRDDEPGTENRNRVLLVGDSFTFGALLDQSETIDSWIERQQPGLDAYNLGVSGYDLPNQLDALRRCTLPAAHVVYLFFGNDIQPPLDQTVLDGYRVTRQYWPDGRPWSDDEMRKKIIASLEESSRQWRLPPRRSILLPRFRATLSAALVRTRTVSTPPDDLYSDPERDRFVARGLKYTLDMRDLARMRGMGFQVAIVPTREEVQARVYTKVVERYVQGLRKSGVETIEILSHLTPGDYWAHNLHFNPHGAKVAADTIYQALPASVKSP